MSNSSNNNPSSDDHSPTPITSSKNDDFNIHGKGLTIMYKECLKNHAASLGGNAKDGCGEFMATGRDNLDCSACGCHRNFHRRELDVGGSAYLPHAGHAGYYWGTGLGTGKTSTPIVRQDINIMQCGRPNNLVIPSVGPISICPKGGNGEDEKRESERVVEMNKKRHRTRFTSEQKEKLLGFAEKSEWKIQKLDEGIVQQFCEEVGIKRRVLKVWMHNNKQHYVNKDGIITSASTSINHISEDPNPNRYEI